MSNSLFTFTRSHRDRPAAYSTGDGTLTDVEELTNSLTIYLHQVPPEIALLQNLERLALSNNCLSSLPPEFKNLKMLRSLHMANNQFVDLPLQLCSIHSLEFLDMSDNQLKVSVSSRAVRASERVRQSSES